MHAYGKNGEVVISDTTGPLSRTPAELTIEDGYTLLTQLPTAIREAEYQKIGQMSLLTPPTSAPGGTL